LLVVWTGVCVDIRVEALAVLDCVGDSVESVNTSVVDSVGVVVL